MSLSHFRLPFVATLLLLSSCQNSSNTSGTTSGLDGIWIREAEADELRTHNSLEKTLCPRLNRFTRTPGYMISNKDVKYFEPGVAVTEMELVGTMNDSNTVKIFSVGQSKEWKFVLTGPQRDQLEIQEKVTSRESGEVTWVPMRHYVKSSEAEASKHLAAQNLCPSVAEHNKKKQQDLEDAKAAEAERKQRAQLQAEERRKREQPQSPGITAPSSPSSGEPTAASQTKTEDQIKGEAELSELRKIEKLNRASAEASKEEKLEKLMTSIVGKRLVHVSTLYVDRGQWISIPFLFPRSHSVTHEPKDIQELRFVNSQSGIATSMQGKKVPFEISSRIEDDALNVIIHPGSVSSISGNVTIQGDLLVFSRHTWGQTFHETTFRIEKSTGPK